jgi:hypothetical protein
MDDIAIFPHLIDEFCQIAFAAAILQSWHVLHQKKLRVEIFDESEELEDQLVPDVFATAAALDGETLTRGPAGEKQQILAVETCGAKQIVRGERPHVGVQNRVMKVSSIRFYSVGVGVERDSDRNPRGL